jgi:hypothetical protein
MLDFKARGAKRVWPNPESLLTLGFQRVFRCPSMKLGVAYPVATIPLVWG